MHAQPQRLSLLLLLPLVAGCGGPTGAVSGTITLKQQPAVKARMQWERLDVQGETHHGIADDEGNYQVDYKQKSGLAPGQYKITITHHTMPDGSRVPGGEDGYNLRQQKKTRSYMVVFERAVVQGNNSFNFEITEGQPSDKQ